MHFGSFVKIFPLNICLFILDYKYQTKKTFFKQKINVTTQLKNICISKSFPSLFYLKLDY